MFPFEERVALWMFFLWFWCSHLRNVEPPCAPGWLQGPPGMGCLLMQVGINITFASDFAGLYNGKGGQLLSCFDLFWCGGRLKHWPGWMRQQVAGETTREHIWNYFETLETLKSPGSTFGRNQEWGTARVSQVGLQCQCWLNITTHTLEMFLFYRYKFIQWTLQIEIYDFHLCRTTVSEFPDNRVYGWWIGATDLNRWIFFLAFPFWPSFKLGCLNREGSWYWAHSLEPMDYSDWYPGEPNNQHENENCAIIYGLAVAGWMPFWDDYHCSNSTYQGPSSQTWGSLYSICQKFPE